MIENQHFHSSTVSQYSATRNTQTHRSCESPAKISGGRADNWLLYKERCLHRGETESCATSCKQYSENKTKKKKSMQKQTHKYACWYVLYEERERIRVSQPAVRYIQKSKQTNMHTRVSVYVYVYEERERISVTLVVCELISACVSRVCVLVLFR
jgi:hypothetical protein